MLAKNAMSVKEEYLGRPVIAQFRRPEFWSMRPWEEEARDEPTRYVYPEEDLIESLVFLYFENVHPTVPLLHRPSFERSVKQCLHLDDHRFGATLLAVLAIASRYSDDPRVFVPGSDSSISSGFPFFRQVQVIRKSLFNEPSLYEVQLYCLTSIYTLGTSSPDASWSYIGLGVRLIQERGQHRRKREGHKITPEDELWKRAFWCLLYLDRTVCAFLGRPSAVHVEDYDVELPLEVDDEYWEHPDPVKAFKQPLGKPSLITYFIHHLRLCEIMGSTLRRMYASNKSRALLGLVGDNWEQRTVAELDSAMSEFISSVPDHLRWDPNRTGVFFDQSAVLHVAYYYLQLTIHRPNIHKSTMTLSSLTMCTTAARNLIHIVDVWLDRMQRVVLMNMQIGVFIAGVILLFNLFGMKRSGLPIDVTKELALVSTAMRILKFQESRWQTAGRLWELLQELNSWDGPPPAKPKPNESTVLKKESPIHEPQEVGASLFTEAGATPHQIFSNISSTVVEEGSPHRIHQSSTQATTSGRWEDVLPPNPSTNVPAQETAMTLEQLFGATGYHNDGTSTAQTAEQVSGTGGFANMMVDDDLMSFWGAAPTTLGNLANWDADTSRRVEELQKCITEQQKQIVALEAKLSSAQPDASSSPSSSSKITPPADASPSPSSLSEEDLSHDELAERFRQFSLGHLRRRFFGSSSGFMLAKNAMSVKEEYLGRPVVTQFRRPEFWRMRPWEKEAHDELPRYVFPEQDLIASLVSLYFESVHPTIPLLHRLSFERSVKQGLHLDDHRFGATLLAVLAIASRYSNDPRVFVPGSDSSISSGFPFFRQVQVIRRSLFNEPSLYEVQLYCLTSIYTLGTSSPEASWSYIGLGVRLIQERGQHRRKREGHKITPEDELWKRAFWCLLYLDRTVCAFLGRPSAVHVEDYDVELPLEVDDEYWEHPDPVKAFKQPLGKPSLITYFIHHLRLCEIMGSTLRRMYASNKSRALLGLVGDNWEQRTVAELDSAMSEFISSVPDHLRWDPNRTGVFFDQSAVLHVAYYYLQLTIHRPNIHKSTMTLSSLTICTTAARNLIHVVDVWLDRMQRVVLMNMQNGVFIAGVILLLNLFGMKRSGLPIDVTKELAHVSTAMRILKFQESRWQTAGRLWELLQELNSWDGPPPAKPKFNEPTVLKKGSPIHEPQEMGASLFAEAGATPHQIFSNTSSTVVEEGSPHRIRQSSAQATTSGRWEDVLLSNPSTNVSAQETATSMEQFLGATGYHNDGTGIAQTAEQISGTSGFANMMVDDDLMSFWGAAPTTLSNLANWDAYIEAMNGPGFNWSTNYDPQLGAPSCAQHQGSEIL
ncbi:Zn(2)-C6 fungal-type domain-containing protein [Mycena venus]|uniref:Zn(2)-C6 fungal-type domain-containing protein n=1 Tax=Mycena venus TaxID=2733690 RepID=A0A8H7CGW0_9AGAR|nr:Zn(2)-C6 fungal-type domain-containing protein [Mycena venus]